MFLSRSGLGNVTAGPRGIQESGDPLLYFISMRYLKQTDCIYKTSILDSIVSVNQLGQYIDLMFFFVSFQNLKFK